MTTPHHWPHYWSLADWTDICSERDYFDWNIASLLSVIESRSQTITLAWDQLIEKTALQVEL